MSDQRKTGDQPPPAVLILGMHRSGTSAVTRLCNLFGGWLGEDLMAADEANPSGYWENQWVFEAHDRFCQGISLPWSSPASMPPDWDIGEAASTLRIDLRAILRQTRIDAAGAPLVFKEPRLCRLMPIWRRLLADDGTPIKVILPIRAPQSVAASLTRRDGLGPAHGHGLWLRYVLEAERESRDLPRVIVDYDALLANWRSSVSIWRDKLGIAWPVELAAVEEKIDSFLQPGLRHHAAGVSPNQGAPEVGNDPLSTAAMDVYRHMAAAAADGAEIDPQALEEGWAALDRLTGEAAAPLIHDLAASHLASLSDRRAAGHEIQNLKEHQAIFKDQIRVKDEAIGVLSQTRDQLNASVAHLREALENQQKDMAEQVASIIEIRAERQSLLEKAQQLAEQQAVIAAQAQTIEALMTSRSWRLTRPLRGISMAVALTKRVLRALPMRKVATISALPGESDAGETVLYMADIEDRLQDEAGPPEWLRISLCVDPWLTHGMGTLEISLDGGRSHQEPILLDIAGVRRTLWLSGLRDVIKVRLITNDVSQTGRGVSLKMHRASGTRYKASQAAASLGQPATVKALAARGWHYLRRGDMRGLAQAVSRRTGLVLTGNGSALPEADRSYEAWIAQYDRLYNEDVSAIDARIEALDQTPRFSILMPVYEPPPEILYAAIQSVRRQIYPHWELCIADDASPSPAVRAVLEHAAREDERIKLTFLEENANISVATNAAFALATGEFCAMLDHDDLLRPHALYMMAEAINERPGARLLYSDEDKIDMDGRRYEPFFKPAWDPDLFYGQNYLNHLTVISTDTIRAAGGWRRGFEGAQDYDMLLRALETFGAEPSRIVHIPHILYHWRAMPGSTAVAITEKSSAVERGRNAVAEHLERLKLPAAAGEGPEALGLQAYNRIDWTAPSPPPAVSIVIPTRDRVGLLRGCVEGLRHRTSYEGPLEILIIDNGSVEEETKRYFDQLRTDKRVRVVSADMPFNFSAINNLGVQKATGEMVLLLNNDIEVIGPDWLTRMVAQAARPGIGCVGAKLLYADNTLQHAGVITGIGGVAGHSHKYLSHASPGYFGRLGIAHSMSAVTAACLLVRKSVYEEVGGLDETLAVAFNDVDFCLRVRAAGYRNVIETQAVLYHLESASRGAEDAPEKIKRFHKEMDQMRARWGEALDNDPFYSPNLSLTHEDFSIGWPRRVAYPWRTGENEKPTGRLGRLSQAAQPMPQSESV